MPSVTMNIVHLLVVLVNVVHALRDQKAMPLIYDKFDGEIAKDDNVHSSQKTASHLEIRETAAADVDRLNHLEHLDLFIPKMEVVTKELAEAKELQLDQLDCSGTSPLSGYFKVSTEHTIFEPCNITADGATLFLEAPLRFNESVEFHGNLSVIAVRRPLDGPCVHLEKDGIVQPGAELRFVNCHRQKGSGGAMEVHGNLLTHGDVHIRNCSAGRGGAIFVQNTFTQSDGTLTIASSSAERKGGAMFVQNTFTQSNGTITITSSSAELRGGAIYVQNTFTQSDGTLTIASSSAERKGGAMFVGDTFTQSNGRVIIQNSLAKRSGGAIFVVRGFTQSHGTLTIANSLAKWCGGAIRASSFNQSDGSLTIENSLAKGHGDAMEQRGTWSVGHSFACHHPDKLVFGQRKSLGTFGCSPDLIDLTYRSIGHCGRWLAVSPVG